MILFLDPVSIYPKLVIVKNNKIFKSINILSKKNTKISDVLLEKYLKLSKSFNSNNKITKLVVCIGPGSYTSLRVSISFMYGLSISMKIPLYGISCTKLLTHSIKQKEFFKTFLLIFSSKEQNFICTPSKFKNLVYDVKKINDNFINSNFDLKKFDRCICNYKPSKAIEKQYLKNKDVIISKIENNIIYEDFTNMKQSKNIEPIYISENKLFDK